MAKRGPKPKKELNPNSVLEELVNQPLKEPKVINEKVVKQPEVKVEEIKVVEKKQKVFEIVTNPKPIVQDKTETDEEKLLAKIKRVLANTQGNIYRLEQYELSIPEIHFAIKNKLLLQMTDYKFKKVE